MTAYQSQFSGPEVDASLRLALLAGRFASPNAAPFVSGRFYDQAVQGLAGANIVQAAGQLNVVPFFVNQDVTMDQLGVSVLTPIAASQARVVIYGADAAGWPSERLFQGAVALDCSTTGYRFHNETFQFQAGQLYWIGVHSSSTQTLHGVAVGSLASLGLATPTGTAYVTLLRQTVTFGDGAPTTWTFAAAQLTSASMASVRMRVA